eukprot:GEMP01036034.1.p1 GENE.GEMP01036034.1~~GEMP01036034.1.p1  ORF type:complete len:259 (+),score=61.93 GEMP01036034.1:146-922(+)
MKKWAHASNDAVQSTNQVFRWQCGWRRDALRGLKGPNPYFDRVPVGWLEDLEQESILNKEEIDLLKNQIGITALEGHPKNAMQRRLEEKRIRVELVEQEAESLREQCEMLRKNIQVLAAKRDDALGGMEALKYRVISVKQRRDYEVYGTTAQEPSNAQADAPVENIGAIVSSDKQLTDTLPSRGKAKDIFLQHADDYQVVDSELASALWTQIWMTVRDRPPSGKVLDILCANIPEPWTWAQFSSQFKQRWQRATAQRS